ncbi:hypothetical protein J1614_003575 [Plenodomus biglobosus]|nr:hypothetical protein J1614_003575 [Plenodomus biglobosus]
MAPQDKNIADKLSGTIDCFQGKGQAQETNVSGLTFSLGIMIPIIPCTVDARVLVRPQRFMGSDSVLHHASNPSLKLHIHQDELDDAPSQI